MTDVELNCRIAMKLYPRSAVHRNGEVIRCNGKVIDFRKPHLMERLQYELGVFTVCVLPNEVGVTTPTAKHKGATLSQAVALAYVG